MSPPLVVVHGDIRKQIKCRLAAVSQAGTFGFESCDMEEQVRFVLVFDYLHPEFVFLRLPTRERKKSSQLRGSRAQAGPRQAHRQIALRPHADRIKIGLSRRVPSLPSRALAFLMLFSGVRVLSKRWVNVPRKFGCVPCLCVGLDIGSAIGRNNLQGSL